MSENKKQKATATAKKAETKFSRKQILEQPEVFNTSGYIIEGALHGKGDEFTKNEVNNHVKEFLKREVK